MERQEGHLVFRVRVVEEPLATVLLLHGLTGDEDSMTIFLRQLPKQTVAFTLRAPYQAEFGGFRGYGWFRELSQGRPEEASLGASMDKVEAFLAEDLPRFGGRRTRLVLMGFSQGGFMGYLLAARLRPQPLGLVAMNAMAPPPELVPDGSMAGLRALVLHGTEDPMVASSHGPEARDRLLRAGAEVQYREYATGHKVNREGMKAIAAWLAKRVAS